MPLSVNEVSLLFISTEGISSNTHSVLDSINTASCMRSP